MNMRKFLFSVISFIVGMPDAFGYGTPTHTAMTAHAVAQSNLTANPNASSIITRLGLRDFNTSGKFSEIRYFALANPPVPLNPTGFEQRIAKDVRKQFGQAPNIIAEDFTISSWMMWGAIREDDNGVETPWGTIGDRTIWDRPRFFSKTL